MPARLPENWFHPIFTLPVSTAARKATLEMENCAHLQFTRKHKNSNAISPARQIERSLHQPCLSIMGNSFAGQDLPQNFNFVKNKNLTFVKSSITFLSWLAFVFKMPFETGQECTETKRIYSQAYAIFFYCLRKKLHTGFQKHDHPKNTVTGQ